MSGFSRGREGRRVYRKFATSGTVPELFRRNDFSRLYRVLPDVLPMSEVIARIANCMLAKSTLPDLQADIELFSRIVREAPLDQLNSLAYGVRDSQEDVQVIRHYYEIVQQIIPLLPLFKHDLDQQRSHSLRLKHATAFSGLGRNKEVPGRSFSSREGIAMRAKARNYK
jgi:hypothetical protein